MTKKPSPIRPPPPDPTLPSMGAVKSPSSSGEHEAVRRMQKEFSRGEQLAAQIERGEVPSTPAPEDHGPVTVRPEELKRAAGRPQQGRVLVADDDPAIRAALVEELRSEGFAVREAEDGLEALKMAVDSPPAPHVVLLDIWMPKLSGHAVRAALQIDRPDIQILMISAADYQELVKQDATYADEFVFTKPFDLDQLIRVVHERALEAQAIPKLPF